MTQAGIKGAATSTEAETIIADGGKVHLSEVTKFLPYKHKHSRSLSSPHNMPLMWPKTSQRHLSKRQTNCKDSMPRALSKPYSAKSYREFPRHTLKPKLRGYLLRNLSTTDSEMMSK